MPAAVAAPLQHFRDRLALRHPIIQAPMAGGGDTVDLVAQVGEAGALGFVGAAYLDPTQILDAADAIRARTARPFGINLFTKQPDPLWDGDYRAVHERVAPFYAELGLDGPPPPVRPEYGFEDQFSAVLDSGAAALSFIFGVLPPPAIQAAKERGMLVIGTATSVTEAIALEEAGVDAVIAQGSEAGGHRGTFMGDVARAMVGTMALVPQIVDAVAVPVIAAGGIMDGRGIVAALALGAVAVQMGTAFLTCDEAGVPLAYKDRIMAAGEQDTRLTRGFSGRWARGIENRFMAAMDEADRKDEILPFPLQNALTRPMRGAAARQGKSDYLSLWAGQATRLARYRRAGQLVSELAWEIEAVTRHLGGV